MDYSLPSSSPYPSSDLLYDFNTSLRKNQGGETIVFMGSIHPHPPDGVSLAAPQEA